MPKVDLRNMDFSQLVDYLQTIGIPPSRAGHIFTWLYQFGAHDPKLMTSVNKEIREVLSQKTYISHLELAGVEKSRDGTIKYLFKLEDGSTIESVLIPTNGRRTLCISSQVGCAMDCTFCLTGRMGLIRNLKTSEIVNQVVAVMENLQQDHEDCRRPREMIDNVVFMGMGEPLANYDNLILALKILMDQKGFEFTERRVTVSTCGIVPKIIDLGMSVQISLAISLHAADDKTRSKLMPINQRYPLDSLLDACRNYPLRKKKVILFEYILIKDINDSQGDARKLAEKLTGIPCRVNLMPFNESPDMAYQCPDDAKVRDFQAVLISEGHAAFVRNRRGADISAACGLLAGAFCRNAGGAVV